VRAFKDCAKLKAVDFPYTISYINPEAYMNCTSLESVKFDDIVLNNTPDVLYEEYDCYGLEYVDVRAFMNCTSIKTLDMPYGCWICCTAQSMFEGCTSLESISIPSSWDYNALWLYGSIFKGCTSIKELHISDLSGNTNCDASELYQYESSNGDVYWSYDANWDEFFSENASFSGWTEEQTIYFDTQTWVELLGHPGEWDGYDGYFNGENTEYVLFANCAAKVYDCDGNQIIYDHETGAVTSIILKVDNATTGETEYITLDLTNLYNEDSEITYEVSFSENTWQDIVLGGSGLFDASSENVFLATFDYTVYDCNGAQFIYDVDTGDLIKVVEYVMNEETEELEEVILYEVPTESEEGEGEEG